jgi:histidine triad (HIT) family protein
VTEPAAASERGPATDPDCLFCRIVAGEIPSRQVYADETAVAFLDVAPWQRGHTLVVPREHVPDLISGPPMLARIGPAVDATARLLTERLGADGLNLISSARSVAGQEVFHLHLHLVPRYAHRPGLAQLFARDDDSDPDELLTLLTR